MEQPCLSQQHCHFYRYYYCGNDNVHHLTYYSCVSHALREFTCHSHTPDCLRDEYVVYLLTGYYTDIYCIRVLHKCVVMLQPAFWYFGGGFLVFLCLIFLLLSYLAVGQYWCCLVVWTTESMKIAVTLCHEWHSKSCCLIYRLNNWLFVFLCIFYVNIFMAQY